MKFEIDNNERTWFVTLTLSPKARGEMDRTVKPEQFEGESEELSKARITVLLIWLRDYMKRLRYTVDGLAEARLRFVAITENHKDGYPHVHMLVHTTAVVKHAMIRKAKWGHGFVDAKLCDPGAAAYLSKYLTKSNAAVRASIHYGRATPKRTRDEVTSPAKTSSPRKGNDRPSDERPSLPSAECGDPEGNSSSRSDVPHPEGFPCLASAAEAEVLVTALEADVSLAKASAPEGLPDEQQELELHPFPHAHERRGKATSKRYVRKGPQRGGSE